MTEQLRAADSWPSSGEVSLISNRIKIEQPDDGSVWVSLVLCVIAVKTQHQVHNSTITTSHSLSTWLQNELSVSVLLIQRWPDCQAWGIWGFWLPNVPIWTSSLCTSMQWCRVCADTCCTWQSQFKSIHIAVSVPLRCWALKGDSNMCSNEFPLQPQSNPIHGY